MGERSQQGYRDGQFVHQAEMSITDRNPAISLPEVMGYMHEVEAIQDPADRLFVGRLVTGEVVRTLGAS